MYSKGFVFHVFQMYFYVFGCISVCISTTIPKLAMKSASRKPSPRTHFKS
jgi:hypothetical protein